MRSRQLLRDDVAHLGVDLVHLGQRQTETRGDGGHDLIVGHQLLADKGFPQRHGFFGIGFPKLQHGIFGDQYFDRGNEPLVGELHVTPIRKIVGAG